MKVSGMVLVTTALLVGCGATPPPCHFAGEPVSAESAGCLVLKGEQLLLVKTHYGGFGPPAGHTQTGESAQCAAERETFEEAGVEVVARDLVFAMDNGFHLFWCDQVGEGEPNIHRPLEIAAAQWYPPSLFHGLDWRYPSQATLFAELVNERLAKPNSAKGDSSDE